MDQQHCHVLLIEDSQSDAILFREHLSEVSRDFNVTWVDHLADGLKQLELQLGKTNLPGASSNPIDIVVADLNLPDSSGLETLHRVVAKAAHLPVVALTELDDNGLSAHAVQQGAQEVLVKGQLQGYWLARSLRHAIERKASREALILKETEMYVAQQVQQALFPSRPPEVTGFDIAGAVFPASEAAGDYFDYVPMVDDYLGIVIGDVSGHGVGPALLMAETRAYLRALAHTYVDVGYMLHLANLFLLKDTQQQRFVSLFFARLHPSSRSFVYCGAGHSGFLLDSGGNATVLSSTSIVLGVMEQADFPCSSPIDLHPGDMLLLLTDGFSEARSSDDEVFGDERVLEVVRANVDRPAAGIIAQVHAAIMDFSDQQRPRDDMTMVVVKAA